MPDDIVETRMDVPMNSGTIALRADTEVDIQVATARRFPRSVSRFMQQAKELATRNTDIASACIYAVPRDGKTIEGPSARFAELVLHAWKNARADGKVVSNDGQYVTARGMCWDLEANTAIGYEVKRRITDRNGETYSADMITVTGNAAVSIAIRNAILKIIPSPFWKPIYQECRKVIVGNAKTFAARLDNMLHEFAIMGVGEERLYGALGVNGKFDITLEHMATLAGFFNALKDGDTTIEEAFPEGGGLRAPRPAQRKSQQQQPDPQAPSPVAVADTSLPMNVMPYSLPSDDSPDTKPPQNIGVIVLISERHQGTVLKLDTGFQCATRDDVMIRAARSLKDGRVRVECITKAQHNPAYVPLLTELLPVGGDEPA